MTASIVSANIVLVADRSLGNSDSEVLVASASYITHWCARIINEVELTSLTNAILCEAISAISGPVRTV